MREIIDYQEYHLYLREAIEGQPNKGRGVKKRLAEHLRCQTSHISHVLAGDSDFSLEQALAASEFFGLDGDDRQYFMLMVEERRAGSHKLRRYYQELRQGHIRRREQVKKIKSTAKVISDRQRSIYYSAWYYSAIHVLISIPYYQNLPNILEAVPLSPEKTMEVLEFLVQASLAVKRKGKVVIGPAKVNFVRSSDEHKMFLKNWRQQAMVSIDRGEKSDFHSTFVISLDEKDVEKVHQILNEATEKIAKVVEGSPSTTLQTLSIDFFSNL